MRSIGKSLWKNNFKVRNSVTKVVSYYKMTNTSQKQTWNKDRSLRICVVFVTKQLSNNQQKQDWHMYSFCNSGQCTKKVKEYQRTKTVEQA